MDPLSGATAFATIIQLLAIYRQERGAREDLNHRDFVEWLERHRHEEIKELMQPAMRRWSNGAKFGVSSGEPV